MFFPKEHRARRHPTNLAERLNGGIRRRTKAAGARAMARSPDDGATSVAR
jgi:transposase-like protein